MHDTQQETLHSKMKNTVKVNDSDASPFIEQKDVILCRSGKQIYHKSEVASFITEDNKPPVEKEWYIEYRPASVVVKAKDLFRSLPVTEEHPDTWVTPQNFSVLAGGTLDKEIDVVALDGEAEGEIGLKSNITFYTDKLYDYYLSNKEVSVGYTCKKHFVDNPEEVGYDIILDEITEVNHLAITKAGRGGKKVAVIDSIIGGIKPMRTGIFAFIAGKKQKVNDSAPSSFGKTVLEAVKNSKGTNEEELAGEMKGVLDSVAILKDCEAKNKLMDIVKDCFDNKEMAIKEEAELTATLDSMYTGINNASFEEISEAFKSAVKDSEAEEDKKEEDSEAEEDKKEEDSEAEEKKEEDSEAEEKDGCNKDSAIVASIMDSLKTELKPLVAEAVKECLGIKDNTSKIEGGVIDSANAGEDVVNIDYSSFLN